MYTIDDFSKMAGLSQSKSNNMTLKKVIVTTRVVYHKIASVEVDVPDDINHNNVRDWLSENEHLFIDELDEKLSWSQYDYGFGLGDGMYEESSESETRYDLMDINRNLILGGHL